jgi:hypothetical protein
MVGREEPAEDAGISSVCMVEAIVHELFLVAAGFSLRYLHKSG